MDNNMLGNRIRVLRDEANAPQLDSGRGYRLSLLIKRVGYGQENPVQIVGSQYFQMAETQKPGVTAG
jgi:hypothetical protein